MIKQQVVRFNNAAKRYGLYRYSSIMLAVIIFVLSVTPSIAGGINAGVSAHGLAYFVLSFSIGLYFRAHRKPHPFLKAAIAAGLYGLLIECVQHFIPYRCGEMLDVVTNFAASFCAALPAWVLMRNTWI